MSVQPIVMDFLVKSGTLTKTGQAAPLIIGTEGHKEALDVIGKELKNNALTPGARTELFKSLDTVMKQVGESGKLTTKQYSDIAKMTADTGFLKAVQEGAVSQEYMDTAQHVMGKTYVEEVKKKVSDVLLQPITQVSNRSGIPSKSEATTLADTVNIAFTGNRVVLQEKGGAKVGAYQSQELNAKEAGQALTQLIHSGAHMEGSNNYEAYWDKNKHKILPSYFPDPAVLKVGGIIKRPNGENYRYNGGNYNDIKGSFTKLPSGE